MRTAPRILLIDDDAVFTSSASSLARDEGCDITVAGNCNDARSHLRRSAWDLVIADLQLPDGSGLDLLDEVDPLRHRRVVVLTGHPSLNTAVQACAMHVAEYLLKPLCPERWRTLLNQSASDCLADDDQLMHTPLIGRSPALREAVSILLRAAPTDASVLITGESGTGKELAARSLHDASGRQGAFVALGCGAIPPDQLVGQLFGQERGGASGGYPRRYGVFEQAAQGTLFLDEVCDLPPHLQLCLLKALDTRAAVTRADGDPLQACVRIVAATRQDPASAMAKGLLREDLYYRLAGVRLRMPALRECEQDVLLLARVFIDRLNAKHGLRKRLAPCSYRILERHLWPGNVRELQAAVQRAYVLDAGDDIVVGPLVRDTGVAHETESSVVFNVGMTMADVERRMLLKTLAHYHNDKTATARALGVSVRTVHNHLARIAQDAAERAA